MNATEQTTAATEIRTVLDRLYAAWSDGDADAFAARYIDDATVAMPGAFGRPAGGLARDRRRARDPRARWPPHQG